MTSNQAKIGMIAYVARSCRNAGTAEKDCEAVELEAACVELAQSRDEIAALRQRAETAESRVAALESCGG